MKAILTISYEHWLHLQSLHCGKFIRLSWNRKAVLRLTLPLSAVSVFHNMTQPMFEHHQHYYKQFLLVSASTEASSWVWIRLHTHVYIQYMPIQTHKSTAWIKSCQVIQKYQCSPLANLIASMNNEYQSLSTTLKTCIYRKGNWIIRSLS